MLYRPGVHVRSRSTQGEEPLCRGYAGEGDHSVGNGGGGLSVGFHSTAGRHRQECSRSGRLSNDVAEHKGAGE